jgi:TonB family protein
MRVTRWLSVLPSSRSLAWLAGFALLYASTAPRLTGSAAVDAPLSQAQTATPTQKPPDARSPDAEGWEAIRGSNSPALFEQFLKEYPDSPYAGAARLKLAALRNSAAPSGAPPIPSAAPALPKLAPPVILRKVTPEYSEEGRAAHIQGNVLVAAQVDERGRAQNLHLVRSLGFGLDKKALESVEQWQFQPATRGGSPVRSSAAYYEVEFRLPDGGPWHLDGTYVSGRYEPGARPTSTAKPELQRYRSPSAAACAEKGGYVVVQLQIDKNGSVSEAKTVTSPSAALGESAVTAVQSWTFKPALMDGKAKPGEGRVILTCEGPGFSVADADRSDSVLRASNGISRPELVFKVEPDYSEEARKAKFQGSVLLAIVIDQWGRPIRSSVMRSLGLGLDEKAAEAVAQWRFKPGMKDGKPVSIDVTVDVNFRLL